MSQHNWLEGKVHISVYPLTSDDFDKLHRITTLFAIHIDIMVRDWLLRSIFRIPGNAGLNIP